MPPFLLFPVLLCVDRSGAVQVVTLSGGQLGYRQSIINFMSDNEKTVHQLPRLPSQVKVLVYEKVDKDGTARILHVRRKAVQVGFIIHVLQPLPYLLAPDTALSLVSAQSARCLHQLGCLIICQ